MTTTSRAVNPVVRILLAVVLASFLTVGLTACSQPSEAQSEDTPIQTVEEFAAAINASDVDAMLDCCDSATQAVVGNLLALANTFMGAAGQSVDMSSIVASIAPEIMNDPDFLDATNVSVQVTPTNLSESISGDRATVTGTWIARVSANGETRTESGDATLHLVMENGQWTLSFAQEIQQGLDQLSAVLGGATDQASGMFDQAQEVLGGLVDTINGAGGRS